MILLFIALKIFLLKNDQFVCVKSKLLFSASEIVDRNKKRSE